MRWTLTSDPNPEIVDQLSKELSIDKVLSKLLVQRGIHSFEEARKLADGDPMVKVGRLVIDVFPWWAAKGSKLD